MLATVLLLAVLFAQDWVLDAQLPSHVTEKELARGKALYGSQCQRCHGPNGDDTGYIYITPLSGLSLRLGDPRMRQFRGPSFTLRGRFYPPDEARSLMAYILTLPGEKGFRRADAIMSPYLLGQKVWNRNYLVVDVRTEAEFRASHIRGSVNFPPRALAGMARPSVAPEVRNRILVLYDEGNGLRAARLWRAIFGSGHPRVAVLDGGFKKWVSENRDVSTEPTASAPSVLLVDSLGPAGPSLPAHSTGPAREVRFDARKTALETGFLPAAELSAYLHSVGFNGTGRYKLRGQLESSDLLAFQLHLLGFAAEVTGTAEIVVH